MEPVSRQNTAQRLKAFIKVCVQSAICPKGLKRVDDDVVIYSSLFCEIKNTLKICPSVCFLKGCHNKRAYLCLKKIVPVGVTSMLKTTNNTGLMHLIFMKTQRALKVTPVSLILQIAMSDCFTKTPVC